MTNFEKYEKEIKAHNYKFGISKFGKILECGKYYNNNLEIVPEPPFDDHHHESEKMACDFCIFSPNCLEAKTKWLYQPYMNPIANVSALDYEIAKALKNKGFNYIIRDCNEIIQVGVHKPVFFDEESGAEHWGFVRYGDPDILPKSLSACAFPYVEYENETPNLISDIIKVYEEEHGIKSENDESDPDSVAFNFYLNGKEHKDV